MTSFEQPDLLDLLSLAREARDEGIATAEAGSDQWARSVVDRIITETAAQGRAFSANDCRPLVPPGVRPALIGARFLAAAKAGRIQRIGYVQSTDPGTHAHPIAQWLAADAVQEGAA